MTNRPLSRHSLPPVFPKIVMLVSTQFICVYLKKQDINIPPLHKIDSAMFWHVKTWYYVIYLVFTAILKRNTMRRVCRCSQCAPMTKDVVQMSSCIPPPRLLRASLQWDGQTMNFRRKIHQSKSSNGLLYEYYV